MRAMTRRNLLMSIASSIVFASDAANALVCDVRRARQGNVSTKSYNCVIGEGKSLTATFVRMSDVVTDSIGNQGLPGDFESLIGTPRMLETEAFEVLEGLLSRYSIPFEPRQVKISFDGRDEAGQQETVQPNSARLRSLGVWDEGTVSELPAFPSPSEMRRAFRLGRNELLLGFLRFARPDDFEGLEQKTSEFLELWRDQGMDNLLDESPDTFGNIKLMAHIGAGSVPEFLPLFFSSVNWACDGVFGGPQYVPPALYIDAMVCENTGSEVLEIDDFFGANDLTRNLRTYSPSTPPGEQALGWGNIRLDPGQSVAGVQRLLFGAKDQYDPRQDQFLSFDRAVYGPTQLPKGVVIGGQGFAFDGRSHNALIVASYSEEGSCPYLLFWCEDAKEWVSVGKVIVGRTRPELAGEESYGLEGPRTRFRLVEREYERTHVMSLALELELDDGATMKLDTPVFAGDGQVDLPIVLEIGQSIEFSFELPEGIEKENLVKTNLTIGGHYEGYTRDDFERRRSIALKGVPGKRQVPAGAADLSAHVAGR
ncbi:hypothetical protein [Hoeflea sp.]|uniref:hypothetical protein n=1 Tax=Hoeflea sp. TaxID=1940281 RepID=UPI003B025BFD